MILLEFDAASYPLEEAKDVGPQHAFVPVLLHAGGIDLLAGDADADGAEVAMGILNPLPDVAIDGLAALYEAGRTGRSVYSPDEHGFSLLFERRGTLMWVHSERRERTVQVPYDRFLATWEDFSARARAFLTEALDPVSNYAWWAPTTTTSAWLLGTLDIWRSRFMGA
jgi:hypothetical protein